MRHLLVALALGAPSTALAQAPAGPNGMTPIMAAALLGQPERVSELLAQGADPDATGDTPAGGNAVNAAFMGPNGSRLLGWGDAIPAAEHARAVEVVRLLLTKHPRTGIAVKVATTNRTPLMLAAEAGAADVVKLLLDNGADPNVANAGGYTALDLAVDRPPVWVTGPAAGRLATVQTLLAAGARHDRAGADKVRPLERARRAGQADAVLALQKAGAR